MQLSIVTSAYTELMKKCVVIIVLSNINMITKLRSYMKDVVKLRGLTPVVCLHSPSTGDYASKTDVPTYGGNVRTPPEFKSRFLNSVMLLVTGPRCIPWL